VLSLLSSLFGTPLKKGAFHRYRSSRFARFLLNLLKEFLPPLEDIGESLSLPFVLRVLK